MGLARFLHTNMITAASMLTISSNATGVVGRGQKSGQGSATLVGSGDYSGTADADYLIQIDAEGTGEIGSATFLWSDDGGATVDASGVATSTSPVALNNGVSVQWAQGTGQDVYVLDLWHVKALLPYGKARLIDRNPDTEHRTAATTGAVTYDINFGSAKAPDALILYKHNLSSGATIRIQADDASDYSSLDVNELVTWTTGSILHYLTTTPRSFRYWRLSVTDAGNADGYYRISDLFLGGYTELSRNFDMRHTRGKDRMADRAQLTSGRWAGSLNTIVETFNLSWAHAVTADRNLLEDIFDALNDTSTRTISPVFVNADSATTSDIVLCEWEGGFRAEKDADSANTYTVAVRLVEHPRTV